MEMKKLRNAILEEMAHLIRIGAIEPVKVNAEQLTGRIMSHIECTSLPERESVIDDQSEPELRATAHYEDNLLLRKRLTKAIGGLRSIAYGDAQTWPNCSSREVAKQALNDCGGEKHDQGRRGSDVE